MLGCRNRKGKAAGNGNLALSWPYVLFKINQHWLKKWLVCVDQFCRSRQGNEARQIYPLSSLRFFVLFVFSGKKAQANLQRRSLEWGRKTKSLTRERREKYAVLYSLRAEVSLPREEKRTVLKTSTSVTRACCCADLGMEENKETLNRNEHKQRCKRGGNRGPSPERLKSKLSVWVGGGGLVRIWLCYLIP